MKLISRNRIINFFIAGLILSLGFECRKADEEDTRITDADGNVYKSVTIGNQVWLRENLKTTRYNNGDLIGTTAPVTLDISEELRPKYQWAYEGFEDNVADYGRLYTWFAASDKRGICPEGWHVPSYEEHDELNNFGEGNKLPSDKLKEAGTVHWLWPNTGTNESGFTALPAGRRKPEGVFCGLYSGAFFWNSAIDKYHPETGAHALAISAGCCLSNYSGSEAFSVRCIKDQ
ncbi:MAG TPA: hypothetical protein DEO60_14985 [Bacteroidales bacterium]|jgi:uncharacterized protein (TIGR02145 family)|nr:hypothetical protein [Bacteroidales bacterium]HBZ22434.1 hypothetical protein [Bacteroidales bacterium]